MEINDDIKRFLQEEVNRQLTKEKENLSRIINQELLYSGQYASAHRLMCAFKNWVKIVLHE